MELNEVFRQRCSVRKYAETPVEAEKLQEVISSACIAPTGKNIQPFRIYILQSPQAIAKIRELTRCAFNAPIVLLFTVNTDEEWKNPLQEGITSGIEDVSIAATYAMLKATDLGLGTCWVNWFTNSEVEQAFGIPENEKSVLLMTLGYPSDEHHPSRLHNEKRPLDQLVRVI